MTVVTPYHTKSYAVAINQSGEALQPLKTKYIHIFKK